MRVLINEHPKLIKKHRFAVTSDHQNFGVKNVESIALCSCRLYFVALTCMIRQRGIVAPLNYCILHVLHVEANNRSVLQISEIVPQTRRHGLL